MRSSNFIIKSVAQKVMAKFGFDEDFHGLKYLEVGVFFMFLESIIKLRAPLHKHQSNVIYHILNKL